MGVRARAVRNRTTNINGVRAHFTQWGGFLPGCVAEQFDEKAMPLLTALPEELQGTLKIEIRMIRELNRTIKLLDKKIARAVKADPNAQLLMTAPPTGPVTALTFISTIDDQSRFDNGHQPRNVGSCVRTV